MITDRDMRDQLTRYVDACGFLGEFDIEATVSDLQARYGTVDLDDIDTDGLHQALERNAIGY